MTHDHHEASTKNTSTTATTSSKTITTITTTTATNSNISSNDNIVKSQPTTSTHNHKTNNSISIPMNSSIIPDENINNNSNNSNNNNDQSSEDEKPECRICRESEGVLISPCRCNTVVHLECLQRWVGYRSDALFPLLSSSARNSCEICRHPIIESLNPTTSTTLSFTSPLSFARCWATMFTVETCLFVFLFVLAVMGHALFVMGVFKSAHGEVIDDEHAHKRVALALANAVVTFSLLLCVQKVVVRWLREAEHHRTTSTSTNNSEQQQQQQQHADSNSNSNNVNILINSMPSTTDRYASRCTTVSQIFLGAALSVIAAAEIFLIIRELPLGGLA